MKKLPLFILAGIDRNDSFARKRLFELNFKNKKIPQYLIDEAEKTGCFSEIYFVGKQKIEGRFAKGYFFIQTKKYLWQNIKIIFDFFKKEKNFSDKQIAILLSDILPSAEVIREIFIENDQFSKKDLIFLISPSRNLRKKRGQIFLKKDNHSVAEPYSGPGGFYILKPARLNQKLIFSLLSLRMPRGVRKIEVVGNKIYFTALESFRGVLFFIWLFFKTFFLSLIFIDKVFLFLKVFLKHQKRNLTIEESEKALNKILIKKKYQEKEKTTSQIKIIDNPVFAEDIDSEDDVFLLKNND